MGHDQTPHRAAHVNPYAALLCFVALAGTHMDRQGLLHEAYTFAPELLRAATLRSGELYATSSRLLGLRDAG